MEDWNSILLSGKSSPVVRRSRESTARKSPPRRKQEGISIVLPKVIREKKSICIETDNKEDQQTPHTLRTESKANYFQVKGVFSERDLPIFKRFPLNYRIHDKSSLKFMPSKSYESSTQAKNRQKFLYQRKVNSVDRTSNINSKSVNLPSIRKISKSPSLIRYKKNVFHLSPPWQKLINLKQKFGIFK